MLQKILRAHRMNVFNPLEQYVSSTQSILTIGTFDGVHVGHQKIIRALVEEAHQKGLLANVLTFFPHPRMVLKKESNIKLIDTLEEKKNTNRRRTAPKHRELREADNSLHVKKLNNKNSIFQQSGFDSFGNRMQFF